MRSRLVFAIAMLAAALLGGCTYTRTGDPTVHFVDWNSQPPSKNAVTVCSGYGCQTTNKVVIKAKDVREVAKVMERTKKADTPHEERRAVAYAVAWMERYVGKEIGTSADKAGMQFNSSGDPTQQDCVDEATNTTAYLMFLKSKGLIKHHEVRVPFAKGNVLKGAFQGNPVKFWPHWTAVLEENKTGQRYAVDSWIYKNGENPAVVTVEEWYIEDIDNLPGSTT